ncbi:ABC transporter permease [Vallitalea pronyensis]|uniref:ABC transporter permease n=1 Tax=Vallitalea pronyensis TaxID=1348613 RepID=A0A8J8SIA5_9FIRM|nr:ABC transporter permease [Vallitalea pronyensis]QUI24298.1 ABC transporter permease [Vallitalea pronyensis]
MADNRFVFIKNKDEEAETTRPSLTYWQDAWRRLKKNKLSMIGFVTIILIVLFAVVGPYFTQYSYSDQKNEYKNLPPILEVFNIGEDMNLYLSKNYNMFLVSDKGYLVRRLELDKKRKDIKNKIYYYMLDDNKEIKLDFSYNLLKDKQGYDYDFTIEYEGTVYTKYSHKKLNRTYLFGTDDLGRDMLTRIMYGARISLLIGFIATLVNFLIGVVYGSISGFEGGRVDNIMMRIVDIINSIPLVLYVILLMVLFEKSDGLASIIIALCSVYWVAMARLVRGQMLSLKEQEFILAARVIGVSKRKIILRHLIPNALGPIIVSMTMMIPAAIFTEAFLSFIGLGVSAPQASWGTLANNALPGLLTYPYQLFFPAAALAITMLAFNFLGDGLRDALDPRLRKG